MEYFFEQAEKKRYHVRKYLRKNKCNIEKIS